METKEITDYTLSYEVGGWRLNGSNHIHLELSELYKILLLEGIELNHPNAFEGGYIFSKAILVQDGQASRDCGDFEEEFMDSYKVKG